MANLPPEHITVDPAPSPVEMAAILAAFGELWPTPVEKVAEPIPTKWRFSGRWWADDRGQRVPGRSWR